MHLSIFRARVKPGEVVTAFSNGPRWGRIAVHRTLWACIDTALYNLSARGNGFKAVPANKGMQLKWNLDEIADRSSRWVCTPPLSSPISVAWLLMNQSGVAKWWAITRHHLCRYHLVMRGPVAGLCQNSVVCPLRRMCILWSNHFTTSSSISRRVCSPVAEPIMQIWPSAAHWTNAPLWLRSARQFWKQTNLIA